MHVNFFLPLQLMHEIREASTSTPNFTEGESEEQV